MIVMMGEKEPREVDRAGADAILKVAKKHSPSCGIYAIEKKGIIDLRKDECKSKEELRNLKAEYENAGYKVYWSER